jgi:tripartite-type tricarboxylate transporter receptor subunit TctC
MMTMSIACCLRRALVASTFALWTANAAGAQGSVEQFYKGRQINIIVGSSAGGGYDAYARLLARHLGNYVPGNPAIVVQNMSGAGSNRAAGYIYGVAPKDGTAIGAIFPGAVLQPLLGDAVAGVDPNKLIYLGSANNDVYICFVRADTGVKRLADATTREIILSASSPGATTYDFPATLNSVVGTKFKIVTGYPGSREMTLAIERGEAQGACGIGWTGLVTFYPEWFSKGFINVIAQLSLTGHPDLTKAGVPLANQSARAVADRQVLDLVFSQGIFGRPFVLPPGVPEDRVAALRKAFMQALGDQGLRAEADKMRLDVEAIEGEALQTLVANLYATPTHIVERARLALSAKPQR